MALMLPLDVNGQQILSSFLLISDTYSLDKQRHKLVMVDRKMIFYQTNILMYKCLLYFQIDGIDLSTIITTLLGGTSA